MFVSQYDSSDQRAVLFDRRDYINFSLHDAQK